MALSFFQNMTKLFAIDNKTFSLIDDEDYLRLSEHRWRVSSNGYFITGERSKRLHRMLMNAPKGVDVDHINNDRLDNRKTNLRICTRADNLHNKRKTDRPCSSIYKGVSRVARNGKWLAEITINGDHINLGHYPTERQASIVYDLWALDAFGEYAHLNHSNAVLGP